MIQKPRLKGFLIVLIILSTLFISVSAVCAEDIENPEDPNQTIENETSIEDNSNISIKNPAKPVTVSQANVIAAAKSLMTFTDKNKKLPNYVTVAGYKYSIPEFYYLMSKTIVNKKNKVNSAITVKYNIQNPTKASGTWVRGKIYSYYSSIYASKLITYVDKNNIIPNFITTAGGNKLQYQTNVYLFAKTLSGTKTALPYYVSIDIKAANPINKYLPSYNRDAVTCKTIGNGSLGYVQLFGPYGNPDSKIKIAYVIGMHPIESNSHDALFNTLANSKNLKYTYYIYKITVTKNPYDYYQGRMNGQLIAQKYIVPNIKLNKYDLVIDVHSNKGNTNGGSYDKTNFIFAPLNSDSSKVIANKLINQIPGLSYYYPSSQTSPPYCTEPIVKSGIKTIIYETYLYESATTTINYIQQLIANIDKLAL